MQICQPTTTPPPPTPTLGLVGLNKVFFCFVSSVPRCWGVFVCIAYLAFSILNKWMAIWENDAVNHLIITAQLTVKSMHNGLLPSKVEYIVHSRVLLMTDKMTALGAWHMLVITVSTRHAQIISHNWSKYLATYSHIICHSWQTRCSRGCPSNSLVTD